MLNVPYVKSPSKNACALACHLMVAKTFFPETTLDELKTILRWQDGYVVWAIPFWLWLVKKGISVTDTDTVPYHVWVNQGFEALQNELSADVFTYMKRWTHDAEAYRKDIRELFSIGGFSYKQRVPEIADLREYVARDALCEVTVNSCALNGQAGFAIHRIVVLQVTNNHIVFHDPVTPEAEGKPNRTETLDHFMRAWPPDVREVCAYELPIDRLDFA